MNNKHFYPAIEKHLFDITKFVGEVLYELEDIVKTQYLKVLQMSGESFPGLETLDDPCRYTKKELWADDELWRKAFNEMLCGEWPIGDGYFLDLQAQGYALLRFYEIHLGTYRCRRDVNIEEIFAADSITCQFMVSFGMLIGDGGKFVKKEIEKLRKRKAIIDTKIRREWMDMMCWIEDRHNLGRYNDVNSLNAMAEAVKEEFETAPEYTGYNHSKQTITRCLKQVYRLKAIRPLILPRKLKRDIDYNYSS